MPVFLSFYNENKTLQFIKLIDPFSCFSEGFKILQRFRDTGELKASFNCFCINFLIFCFKGRFFRFEDWFYKGYPVDDQFNMFTICMAFVFMTFFYMLLYVYLSNVFPGKYGTPQPFYFIFMVSFLS